MFDISNLKSPKLITKIDELNFWKTGTISKNGTKLYIGLNYGFQIIDLVGLD